MATLDYSTKNIREMENGEYTILSYENKKSKFGKSYILSCTSGDKVFSIWSNIYLANYIYDVSPTKKFKINILDGIVTIPGYSRLVILK